MPNQRGGVSKSVMGMLGERCFAQTMIVSADAANSVSKVSGARQKILRISQKKFGKLSIIAYTKNHWKNEKAI